MNANTHTHTLAEMQSELETADKRNKTQTGGDSVVSPRVKWLTQAGVRRCVLSEDYAVSQ